MLTFIYLCLDCRLCDMGEHISPRRHKDQSTNRPEITKSINCIATVDNGFYQRSHSFQVESVVPYEEDLQRGRSSGIFQWVLVVYGSRIHC